MRASACVFKDVVTNKMELVCGSNSEKGGGDEIHKTNLRLRLMQRVSDLWVSGCQMNCSLSRSVMRCKGCLEFRVSRFSNPWNSKCGYLEFRTVFRIRNGTLEGHFGNSELYTEFD